MASIWPVLSLREAGVSLIDCEHRTPPATPTGYPYVAIPQIKDGRIDLTDVRRISREHFTDWTRKAKPEPHDVVLSRRCNPGETAYVPQGLEFAVGQNLVLLRADGRRTHRPFLRWLVRSPAWWEQVKRYINVGAVFDSLKCADIPNFRLQIPPFSVQCAIADILGAIDDKIELNRRMNETLEEMARAIFRSWFVDFDPVRAKAEGRRPYGMDAEIAALFPDSFEGSELGKIPRGWMVSRLGDLCDFRYGKALREQERIQGDIPVYGSNGRVGYHAEALTRGPGIIVGRKGNPGIVTWSPTDFWCIDTTFYVVPKRKSIPLCYLFFAFGGLGLDAMDSDSAVPGLNRDAAYSRPILDPRDDIAARFDALISSLMSRRHWSEKESRTLAAIRDALLPKLVSGEIRVKDAERFVGEVA